MNYGISTSCFYPGLLERAVDVVSEWHPPVVEIFINTISELEPHFIREMRHKFNENGTEIISIHPFTSALEPLLFFSEYERRFYDSVELYKRYFEAAAELGARYFVMHGDRKDSTFDWQHGYERFAILDHAAKEFGIRVAHENVSRCLSCSPDYMRGLKEYLDGDVKFVLDLKQCRRSGVDVYDMLEAMGKNVVHLHVSDCNAEQPCLPIGAGDFDFAYLIHKLNEIGYDGAMIIELYRENYSGNDELHTSLLNLERYFTDQQKMDRQ